MAFPGAQPRDQRPLRRRGGGQATEKSGALITARHALEAGRDVWAVPGPIGFAECRGTNALLADGAGVLWDIDLFADTVAPESASQRLAVVGTSQETLAPTELPEREAVVLMSVGFEPTEVDVVARRSGIGMRELLPALAMLELKGYVTRDAAGAFMKTPTAGGRSD